MKLDARYEFIDAEASTRRADDIIHWFRDFAGSRLNSHLMDARRMFTPHLVLELGNHGVFGMSGPTHYGGLGLLFRDWIRVLVQLAGVDLAIANFIVLSTGPGIRPLVAYGSPRIQEEFLPGLLTGRTLAAFAQTEPGAGSDFQAMKTSAVVVPGGGYKISGEKLYIGNASWSTVMTVMAYLERADGQPGGLTTFAVPTARRGVNIGQEATTTGIRGFVQNRLRLEDVEVDDGLIIGRPEGGIEVGLDNMSFSRISIAAAAIGGMRRCLQLAHRFASRRPVSSGRLIASPVWLAYFTDTIAKISVSEALLHTLAGQVDSGQGVPIEVAAAAKVSATEMLGEISDGLVQILGGRGYDEANVAPRIGRDARIGRIFEGATEVMLLFLGQRARQRTSGIYTFLEWTTKTPGLAEELRDLVEGVFRRTWKGSGPLADDGAAQQWRFFLAGRAALWALLTGAAEHYLPQAKPPHFGTTLDWIRLRFDEVGREVATAGVREQTMLSVEDVETAVNACVDVIGDVEQTLPGENHELDTWLRRDYRG